MKAGNFISDETKRDSTDKRSRRMHVRWLPISKPRGHVAAKFCEGKANLLGSNVSWYFIQRGDNRLLMYFARYRFKT